MADCTGVFLLGKSSNMNSCKICLGRSRETKIAWWNVGRKEQKTSVCVVGGGYTWLLIHSGQIIRNVLPLVKS